MQVLLEQPAKLMDGGLRIEEVIDRANSSNATFYRKFATKSRFLVRVLDQLIDDARVRTADVCECARQALDAADGDRIRAVRELVITHFDAACSDRNATTRLLAHTLGPTAPRGGLQATYRHTDQLILAIFEVLFAKSGATLRKPLTKESFCVVLSALLEGFLIRRRVEPAAVPAELVAAAVLGVLNVAVDTEQRHEHIEDALTALAAAPALPTALPSEPRAALLSAARTEFTKRGYFMTGIEAIATEARVPLDKAKRIFPTKTQLILDALKPAYASLRLDIADDAAIGYDAVAIVHRHFVRCARLVAAERAFMDALMAAVAHDTYAEEDGLISIRRELDFPGLLVPILTEAQGTGVFADDQPPQELAALLTNTLLLRCFTRRSVDPDANAEFVSTLVLNGLRRR
ncbi:TetR family transcriptional regulator [Nocardia brasiliensis]|uniref:TetR family transcriptional regulator n=1 Tax=Nocardia brasiliensis (strain ATCC 700358 / HUJEG-1) TaxID=1133849 RepID=K0EWW0_NOCB7|nr:TetR family transcriptional regulator [Nocardia brasiliensis ATCC 700358]OCF87799.1 TetR family transcriptional regulator [Nocardia brasiliensis]